MLRSQMSLWRAVGMLRSFSLRTLGCNTSYGLTRPTYGLQQTLRCPFRDFRSLRFLLHAGSLHRSRAQACRRALVSIRALSALPRFAFRLPVATMAAFLYPGRGRDWPLNAVMRHDIPMKLWLNQAPQTGYRALVAVQARALAAHAATRQPALHPESNIHSFFTLSHKVWAASRYDRLSHHQVV
jgi:hypothetical protein